MDLGGQGSLGAQLRPSDLDLALLGETLQHIVSPVPPQAGIICRAGSQRKGEAAALPAQWVLFRPSCGWLVSHSGSATCMHCECATDTTARDRKQYLRMCSLLGCTGSIAERNGSAPAPAPASLPSVEMLSRMSCKEKAILKDVTCQSGGQHPCSGGRWKGGPQSSWEGLCPPSLRTPGSLQVQCKGCLWSQL